MTNTVEMLQARINLLKERGEEKNKNIINKIKREIRKLEQK
jgi:hypothetical protein